MSPTFKAAIESFIAAASDEQGKLQAKIDKEEGKDEIDDEKVSDLQDRIDSIQNAIDSIEEIEDEKE